MPLYFFHVFNSETTMDEEGQEFPDSRAARVEAIRSARELICQNVRDGDLTLSHRIEVEDEAREPVLTLTFGEAFQINP